MPKILVAVLIAVLSIPAGGFAQTWPAPGDRDGTIRTQALQLRTGILRGSADREPGALAALRPAARQQRPAARKWPGRHPVLFGALVGLGVGLGVEAVVIPGASGGEPHGAYRPMFGTIGAGIGSLVGVIVSAARR
jgi:hypothetical protein